VIILRLLIYVLVLIFVLKEFIEIALELINLNYSTSPKKEIPEVFKSTISKDEFDKSKKYLKDKTILDLISNLTGLIISLLFIFIVFPYFEKFALKLSSSFIIQGLIFFGIYGLVNLIISLPFSIYSTFVIEEKYGFNTTKPVTFIIDLIKSIIISIILGGAILSIILWIIKTDNYWWWKFLIVITAFQLLSIWLYPTVIAPLFNKFTSIKDDILKNRIFDLAKKAKFSISNIYIMDESKRSKKANAYFTGFGRIKKLVLFDTLSNYPVEEICAIFAHEVGHFKKSHMSKILLLNFLLSLFYIYLTFILFKSGALQIFFKVSMGYTLLIYSFLFTSSIVYFLNPILNMILRKYEYDADKFSVELIGAPEPMINGLIRLVKDNLTNLYPLPLYATWYYSHPTPQERILTLEKEKII
jgi:STE24 endopeptidase